MQEKQDKLNKRRLEILPDGVFSDKMFSFIDKKELGIIRLTNKRFNFLTKDRYSLYRLLDYINKGKLADAKKFLTSCPNILEHNEYSERFIRSCLEEGNVEEIKLLLDQRPEFVLNKKYEPLIGSYLLKYGVKANQDAAELLIKKNPNLLLFKGDVVDDSGRYFKNVTFLQVITWCLDVFYMGNMVYQSLPKDEEGEQIRKKLSQQLDEQCSKGLSFELKIGDYLPKTEKGQAQKKQLIAGIKNLIELKYLNYEFKEGSDDTLIIKNETHFDLTPLPKALQDYADHCNEWNNKQSQAFWCTVIGLLQTLLPLYIRQHYCAPEEAFYPEPAFDKKEFKRCLYFDNWIAGEELFDCSAFGLGLDYGLEYGCGATRWAVRFTLHHDSTTLSALFERRSKQDLSSLLKTFKQPLIQIEETLKFGF